MAETLCLVGVGAAHYLGMATSSSLHTLQSSQYGTLHQVVEVARAVAIAPNKGAQVHNTIIPIGFSNTAIPVLDVQVSYVAVCTPNAMGQDACDAMIRAYENFLMQSRLRSSNISLPTADTVQMIRRGK